MRHLTRLTLSACSLITYCLAAAGCAAQPVTAQPATAQPATAGRLPGWLYGVTIDEVINLSQIVASLQHLPRRPVARIVFDPGIGPADYRESVDAISKVAYIMAEPVDSSEVTGYSPAQYAARFRDYLAAFRTQVSIWEVGNEANGNWLGPAGRVTQDIRGAYSIVTGAGGQTALTLTYEPGCAGDPSHDMWTWAARNIPAGMKQGLDYVLVSYYQEDCGNYRPAQAEWDGVFRRLHELFPNAKLGFGEVGANQGDPVGYKLAYLSRYYRLHIDVPQYVGGYFWWYYSEDMIPYQRSSLWHALAATVLLGPVR